MAKLMFPVFSSNIKEIGHDGTDGESGSLTVRFTNGVTYEYESVPESIYQQFRTADSAGKFYHSEIRGKFEGRKVEE